MGKIRQAVKFPSVECAQLRTLPPGPFDAEPGTGTAGEVRWRIIDRDPDFKDCLSGQYPDGTQKSGNWPIMPTVTASENLPFLREWCRVDGQHFAMDPAHVTRDIPALARKIQKAFTHCENEALGWLADRFEALARRKAKKVSPAIRELLLLAVDIGEQAAFYRCEKRGITAHAASGIRARHAAPAVRKQDARRGSELSRMATLVDKGHSKRNAARMIHPKDRRKADNLRKRFAYDTK